MGDSKKRLMLAAVIIGLIVVGLVLLYGKSQSDKVEQITGDQVEVAKAAVDIVAGTQLQKENVFTESVPRQFLPPNPLEASEVQMYIGTPLAVNVSKGGMILTSDFITAEKKSGLSSKIPILERAMSIAVDEISGVSGLIMPGDRVDILATFPISSEDQVVADVSNDQGSSAVGYLTVPMLQNVTILAVGSQIAEVRTDASGQGQGYGTVTVSVTIDEAESLTIAQTRGKLMLILRNRDDYQDASVTKKTLREVLEKLEVIQKQRTKRIAVKLKPKKKPTKTIEIVRGDK